MAAVHATMRAFMTMRQKDQESLINYLNQFKAAKDVLASHLGGPIILTKYVMQMDDYDPFDPDENVKLMDVAYKLAGRRQML